VLPKKKMNLAKDFLSELQQEATVTRKNSLCSFFGSAKADHHVQGVT